MEVWKAIGTYSFFVGAVGANIFILSYAILARWWRTEFGPHLFSFMFVVALVFDHEVAQLIWPDYQWRSIVRACLNAAAAIVIWWRVVILMNVQVRRRRDKTGSEGRGEQ